MILYFLLNIGYLNIKQKTHFTKIKALSGVVQRQIQVPFRTSKNLSQIQRQPMLWSKFRQVNKEIGEFYGEMNAQDTFWSKYLTSIFAFYLIETVYVTYTTLFVASSNELMRWILILGAVYFFTVLLFITWFCSKLIKTNLLMAREMQRIALKHKFCKKTSLGFSLKIERMFANYKNIRVISFKLLDNYRIDSEMFQNLFYLTSVLFMMIFSGQEKK